MLQEVEPGLEENKDFRTKLRKAENTKIDTKAAFPSKKKEAEQVDFRNLLRKTTGPEKKSFKVEQVDFREKIKAKVRTIVCACADDPFMDYGVVVRRCEGCQNPKILF